MSKSDMVDIELGNKEVKKVSNNAQDLKEYLRDRYPNGVKHENLVECTTVCVKHLSTRREMTGQQKKNLIIEAILLLLDETDSGYYEKFEPIVKLMIPTVIDNMIDIEKGKIKLNKKVRRLCCCCM